eukprot:scaffold25842_cov198-Amphora_coffeaeformis.AAC.2
MAVTTATLLAAPQQAKTESSSKTNRRHNHIRHHNDVKKASPRSGRVVAFDETANQSYDNTQWSAEKCKRHWYTKFDYQQIKEHANSLAKQIHRQERRGSDPESYSKVLVRVYEACAEDTVLSENDQALLVQLMGKAQNLAGLEKTCLAQEKRFRRQQLLATVHTIQKVHHHNKQARSSHRHHTRRVSQAISRPSCLFAQHMAQALAASLQA